MRQVSVFPCKIQVSNNEWFTLTRLNRDSSWLIEFWDKDAKNNERREKQNPSCRILVDPWLEPTPAIDGGTWFSCTYPADPSMMNVKELSTSLIQRNNSSTLEEGHSDIDAIIISLPFSDHCHEDTLETFPNHIPIIAANGSFKRLEKYFGQSRTIIDAGGGESRVRIPFTSFDIMTIESKLGILDPTHRGVLITPSIHNANIENDNIFRHFQPSLSSNYGILYSPHGLNLSSSQKSKIISMTTCRLCLLSTITLYELPLLLGGNVNLGIENAIELIHDLNVTDFIPTHSSHQEEEDEERNNNNIDTGTNSSTTSTTCMTGRQYDYSYEQQQKCQQTKGLVTKFSKVTTMSSGAMCNEHIKNVIGKDVLKIAEVPRFLSIINMS